MKLLILALAVVLNTGCASYCLSSIESSYNDQMKEVQDIGSGKSILGQKFNNYEYKEQKGTLYSFEGCLQGEGRLLHVFIPLEESDHSVKVFEDEGLPYTGGEEVCGFLNLVPPFIEEKDKEYDAGDPIQINLSQVFMCHAGGYTSATVIVDGKEHHAGFSVDMKERSSIVSGLIKSGYIITIPVDIVVTPPLIVVAGTVALFKSFW